MLEIYRVFGSSRSSLEAERTIAYFKPSVILFVGIVGGIKNVKLGDYPQDGKLI
jgi:nucleoside phosphorylase